MTVYNGVKTEQIQHYFLHHKHVIMCDIVKLCGFLMKITVDSAISLLNKLYNRTKKANSLTAKRVDNFYMYV